MQGADVVFKVKAGEGAAASADAELQVYTTRPDTLFGVTYMVVAPEHALLPQLTSSSQQGDVEAYVETARNKSDLERTGLQKDKSGVFTGGFLWSRTVNTVQSARPSAGHDLHGSFSLSSLTSISVLCHKTCMSLTASSNVDMCLTASLNIFLRLTIARGAIRYQ